MDTIGSMDYQDLVDLKSKLDERIKQFRRIRIKMKWKRCGKKDCFCKDGPSDGSWENLHGPYVFAQFVDHGTKKTRLVSLGRHYDHIDIDEVEKQILDKTEYFTVPDSDREKMNAAQKKEYCRGVELYSWEFEAKYGIKMGEDTMGRHKKWWGTKASEDRWVTDASAVDAEKSACMHPWAVLHGIGSPVGQKVLEDLLRQNYYLAPV